MTTYTVTWSSNNAEGIAGKTAISIPQQTLDTTSTTLTLTGKGTQYGQIQQQNFIRLLENFASVIPPVNPTVGQLWFNPTDAALYCCAELAQTPGQTLFYQSNGKGWINIGNIGATSGPITVLASSIINALGYTPYPTETNPNGYIASVSSTNITNALGYIPYNAANPNSYISAAQAPVQSVAGKTGAVALAQADITGLKTTDMPTFAGVSLRGGTAAAINPTDPVDGDIKVAGSIISIYAAGGWNQVFPAVYS
jgi:hypothetical protein